MLESQTDFDHIPPPDRDDWYTPDRHLQWLVRHSVGEGVWPVAEAALSELGRLVPQRIEPLVRLADRHPPVLQQYSGRGERVDVIEFHPAYAEIERTVTGFGAVRMAYSPGWRGLRGVAPRPLTSAVLYMFLQSDQSITGCPIGMMDAMCHALQRNHAELAARFVPRIASDRGDHLRSAMFLTEKAGGSDVGANQARAVAERDGSWRLHGEKWFCSCPHSDLVLVMARPDAAVAGTRGLGLFLMPRLLEDGTRNTFIIHRLKEKFGTRAMPSAEVGLRGAFAWQVGDLDRGMQQMLDMVNLTRVSIVTASAAAMRRCAHEALTHTAGRRAFGAPLDTHPLMRDTLADLVVDATAGLSSLMALSTLLDRSLGGDRQAATALRVMTPLLKGLCTERARVSATEAMEVRGGNGFVEDWPEPRLLRDVSVHAIWEGSGNVIALDVLRALRHAAAEGYVAEVERHAEAAVGPAGALGGVVLAQLSGVRHDLSVLAALEPQAQELRMRRLARRMAMLATSSWMSEQAAAHAVDTGDGRLLWLTARYLARLGGEPAVSALADDASWLEHAPGLLRGSCRVPLAVGTDAAARVAAVLGTGDATRG